jgi:drug/metabolite transporter (DMT)-like permease
MFAAFLSTLLFSVSVISGHRTARIIGGVEANFWRLALATVFLGMWAFSGGVGLGGAAFPWFLLSGIIGIGVGDAGLFQALPRLGSRLSLLLIQCLTAPVGAIIEWLWLGTTLHAFQWLGVVVILAGVGAALAPSEHLHLPRRQLVVGVLFALLGVAGNALGVVLSRKAYLVARASEETLDGGTAAFQRILGGLVLAAVFLLLAKRQHVFAAGVKPSPESNATLRAKWRRIAPWVLLNSLAGQTLGVSCMQWALETTPTGIVMAIVALTPLTVIPLARIFEGEKITWRAVGGGGVAVAGVVLLVLTR